MIQDNTAKWRKKKLSNFASNNALPLGFMYQHLSSTVPLGSLPLLGGEYDRTLYADLWSWANENGLVVSEAEWQESALAQGGSCSKFSDGNGSTTFRVPALKCWIKGANGVSEVGSYLEAGLPRIHLMLDGTGNNTMYHLVPSTGKIENIHIATGTASGTGVLHGLPSAWCSSVYRDDIDTVQPPSIVGMWCIVAYGTVTNVGNVDVAEYIKIVNKVSDRQEQVLRSFSTDGHLVLPDGSEFWIE